MIVLAKKNCAGLIPSAAVITVETFGSVDNIIKVASEVKGQLQTGCLSALLNLSTEIMIVFIFIDSKLEDIVE